ncbi:YezD family protein [uncultured Sphingomonas sp.]|uniref:YezD family protein n=1 Tax=uncultured Sphingomonas sp. TaxID=158754 RepID=UPI0030F85888
MIDHLPAPAERPAPPPEPVLRAVEEAIAGLDYGSIVITVHGARVVQLDVTRRRRFAD